MTSIRTQDELMGFNAQNEKIQYLRGVRERLKIKTPDIVTELEKQGYFITYSSLQAYMQGNIRGTDSRKWSSSGRSIKKNHLDDLVEQFKKIEKKILSKVGPILAKEPNKIIDDWYTRCHIHGGMKERQLSEIVGVSAPTIYKWYRYNKWPESVMKILECEEYVREYEKKFKKRSLKAK